MRRQGLLLSIQINKSLYEIKYKVSIKKEDGGKSVRRNQRHKMTN